MPVRRVIAGCSASPGSTKVAKRSPTLRTPCGSSAMRAAPISTMRSTAGSNPVVSRSIAMRSTAVSI
jgi:hypothetical protein